MAGMMFLVMEYFLLIMSVTKSRILIEKLSFTCSDVAHCSDLAADPFTDEEDWAESSSPPLLSPSLTK